jgi:hypothetical protein
MFGERTKFLRGREPQINLLSFEFSSNTTTEFFSREIKPLQTDRYLPKIKSTPY